MKRTIFIVLVGFVLLWLSIFVLLSAGEAYAFIPNGDLHSDGGTPVVDTTPLVKIPHVHGDTLAQAERKLRKVDLHWVIEQGHNTQRVETILPQAGGWTERGSFVILFPIQRATK